MQTQPLQSAYSGGVVRDLPRHMLPAGSVWSLIDFIPNLEGAPLAKRGGWSAGPALSGAASLNAIAYTPFNNTDIYCVIDDRGHLWESPVGVANQVLASNPSLYWRLGEAPGASTAADASGHGNTGSYGSGVTLGQVGAVASDTDTAVLLDNTANGNVLSSYSPFVTGSKRTFMGWAKRNATTDADTLIGGQGTVSVAPPRLYINSGNEDVIWNTGANLVTWAAAWPGTGVWVHWALTYDDSTRVAELFINGVSKGTATVSTAYGASTGVFRIGEFAQTGIGAVSPFNGYMDEVAVFESILTGSAIAGIYNATAAWSDKGAAFTTKQRPIYFNGKLNILDALGASAPKIFDGSTISANPLTGLTGVHPKWGTTYKSRLVIADDTTLYFSNALDGSTYDVNSFVKATYPITGLAALPNAIMIFSAGHAERLRGTTPPSSTSAGDMSLEPAFAEGCVDARSIVVYQDQVIWANLNGVHISDGAAVNNLIEVGGIREYWHSLMESYSTQTPWTFAGGVFKNRYVISITDANGGFIAALLYDLGKKSWAFLSNLQVKMFTESGGATPELAMALSNHNYVGYFSPCFDPSGSSTDGDGTAVQPVIEFPFFRMGPGKTRWRDIFLAVDFVNSAAELQFYYTTSPDGTSYKLLKDSLGNAIGVYGIDPTFNLDGTVGDTYAVNRIPLHLLSNGIGLKVVQVGASDKTVLFELEAEARMQEGRF